MIPFSRRKLVWAATTILLVAGIVPLLIAQEAPVTKNVAPPDRFPFEVVESFDAKYEGDTPGHIGRHGELGDRAPLVALGDPVFRDETKVGTVTNIVWSRATGSLEVEFDPSPNTRVRVGEVMWLKLGTP